MGAYFPSSSSWSPDEETKFYARIVTPIACIAFPATFLISYHLLRWYYQHSQRFRNASSTDDLEFRLNKASDHMLSTVHAAIISCIGIWIAFSTAYGDLIHGRSTLTRMFPFIITPYMLVDIFCMYWVARAKGASLWDFWRFRRTMILHHILVCVMVIPVVSFKLQGRGDFFIGCYLLSEIPMIFLNVYQALEALGVEHFPYSWLLVLGVAANIGWLFFRVLIIPGMYWALARFWQKSIFATMQQMPQICHVGNLIAETFFVYWWVLIMRKSFDTVKTVEQFNKEPSSSPNESSSNGGLTHSSRSYRVPHIAATINTIGENTTTVTARATTKKAV